MKKTIIKSKELIDLSGMRTSWISKHFSKYQLGYLSGMNNCVYYVEDIIRVSKHKKEATRCRNVHQEARSKAMFDSLIAKLESVYGNSN